MNRNPKKGVLVLTCVFGRVWVRSRRPRVSTLGLVLPFLPWLSKFSEKHAEAVESAVRASNAPLFNGKSERGLDSVSGSLCEPRTRASGKSAAQRSEQRKTSGGAVAVLCCNYTLSHLVIECGAVAVAVAGAVCNLQPMPLRLVYAATLSRVEGFTAGFGGESNVCK